METTSRLNAKSVQRSAVVQSREQQHLQRMVTGIEKQRRQAANELRFLQSKLIDRAAAKHLVPHESTEQRPRSGSLSALYNNHRGAGPNPQQRKNEHVCGSPPATLTTPSITWETLSLPHIDYPAEWNPSRRSTTGSLRGDDEDSIDPLQVAPQTQRSSSQEQKQIRQSRSREDLNTTTMASAERLTVGQPTTACFYSSNMTPGRSPTFRRKNQLLNVKEALQTISHLRRCSSGPDLRQLPEVEKPDLASMREYRYVRMPPK